MKTIHDRTIELLPWYVNGSLAREQAAECERHVRECVPCRAALQDERHMHRLVRAQEAVPLSAEVGLSELLSRIEEVRLRARRRRPTRRVVGWAAAAAGIAAVSAFLLMRFSAFDTSRVAESYATATSPQGAESARVDVVFADGVREAEIAELLADLGGEIVAGPTALGRYTVSVPIAGRVARESFIDALNADPRVRFTGRNFIAAPGQLENPK